MRGMLVSQQFYLHIYVLTLLRNLDAIVCYLEETVRGHHKVSKIELVEVQAHHLSKLPRATTRLTMYILL